jgi:hypothetical protein
VRATTAGLCLVTLIALLLWDVFAMVRSGPEATISVVVHDFASRNPIVPLFVGIVVGHIFWPVGGGRQ